MLNFEKNRNADSVVKELCDPEAEFISKFNIEELLDSECSHAILSIYKTYIEKKTTTTAQDQLICQLILNEQKQAQVVDHLK